MDNDINNVADYFTSNASFNPSSFADKLGSFFYGIQGANAANNFSAYQAALNRKFQSDEARLAFERELQADSTKYQRAVKDLEAAGFNPLMAVSGLQAGSVSASSPSGDSGNAVASAGSTILSALLRGISQIVSASVNASGRASALASKSNSKN